MSLSRKSAMPRVTPESGLLRACLDFLAAERIPAWRMNSGMARIGRHFIRFGEKGMADILAFPTRSYQKQAEPKERDAWASVEHVQPLWIECKTGREPQSEEQKLFQAYVISRGMWYVLVRDDVSQLDSFLKRMCGC